MKGKMSTRLGVIIAFMFLIVAVSIFTLNYFFTYKQTYESAGIEAFGCANITTGLIDPADLHDVMNGNNEKLSDLQTSIDWTTEHKHIFEDQYIIHLDGTIIAPDSKLEEQGFNAGDTFYLDQKALNNIKSSGMPDYSEVYEYGGMKRLTGYAPIFKDHDPNQEMIALSAIDFNADILTERTLNSIKMSTIVGTILLILVCIFTILLIRKNTQPITTIMDYANKIADGDLTTTNLPISSKDEIGQLADYMHTMRDKLRAVITNLAGASETVKENSKELTQSASQVKSGSLQIASTMQAIASGAETQANNAADLSTAMTSFAKKIDDANRKGKQVQQSSNDVLDITDNGQSLIHASTNQMEKIETMVEDAFTKVSKLDTSSKEISELVSIIQNIADQTNLLALNAAIEAARAGEHGKGFAVVAEEVRKLAEEVSGSLTDITAIVMNIQTESTSVTNALQNGQRDVKDGVEQIKTTSNTFYTIDLSIKEMIENTQFITTHLADIKSTSEQMKTSIEEISAISQQSVAGVEETSVSSQETSQSMEDVSNRLDELSTLAEKLNELVLKFRV